MAYAQAVYEEQANRRRQPAPNYQVNDMVYLDSKNIVTGRPSRKLDWKKLGPFRVTEKISSHDYRLELPEHMKIHNVFHPVRLQPAGRNPFPIQIQDQERMQGFSEANEDLNNNKEPNYYVRKIIDYQLINDQ